MAKKTEKDPIKGNTGIRDSLEKVRKVLGSLSLNLYGTDRKPQADDLLDRFDKVVSNHSLNDIDITSGNKTLTTFVGELFTLGNERDAVSPAFRLDDISAQSASSMTAYLEEAYHNRKFKQIDIQEVTSNLVELKESVNITRDAILSPDDVEGRIQRELKIDLTTDEDCDNIKHMIETMEDKFDLTNAIKKFIVPNTLTYGGYYVYNIPYSAIFNKFIQQRQSGQFMGNVNYLESTDIQLLDFVNKSDKAENEHLLTESARSGMRPPGGVPKVDFFKDLYTTYESACEKHGTGGIFTEKEFKDDVEAVLGNIVISNDPIPLPLCYEGFDSLEEYMKEYVAESGDREYTEDELNSRRISNGSSLFTDLTTAGSEGVYSTKNKGKNAPRGELIKDLKDVYIKYLDPIKVIPLKLMSKTIGYYYIIEDKTIPANSTSSKFANAMYGDPFNPAKDEYTIIASIADRIVKSFDKEFLKNNMNFRELIVEAIQYVNITSKRIRFQYIPVEYMSEFKIEVDEDGNGVSMLDNAISYARLYLTLLMFKVMTIITQSNDTRVNYVKSSPLDRDVTGKIQRIIRKKQTRSINIRDLWSYSTVANKVGQGSEMYVPVGTSGERALETEILQGQDVQLHTDLLEMLRNTYILATGVPAAIINYLSEADFAKVVEQNNTKFLGRCVNYALDFSHDITEFYKKLMRWSTNIEETDISRFKFVIPPPKATSNNVANELISAFDQKKEFLGKLMFGEEYAQNPAFPHFCRLLAKEDLPSFNWDMLEKLKETAESQAQEDETKKPPVEADDFGVNNADFNM